MKLYKELNSKQQQNYLTMNNDDYETKSMKTKEVVLSAPRVIKYSTHDKNYARE